MDFVAQIARTVLNRRQRGERPPEKPLRFVLYCSFLNQDHAIGFNLLSALHDFCEHNGYPDFRLVMRYSQHFRIRWNPKIIKKALNEFEDREIRQVWCCGPPPMTEIFDRVFGDFVQNRFKGLNL